MAVFHSLPKVHKGGFPPPLRPIVAGISSLNEHLCAWLDSYLQPLMHFIPGFLRDTKQVLQALDKRMWIEGSVWITADVTDRAILALDWFLNIYSDYDVELRQFLILVTEYLLPHNFFMFNDIFYLYLTVASIGGKIFPFDGQYLYVLVGT